MTVMNEKEFDYINMIPFIDVMLVLLTIVLTTSTFAVTGIIPVDLPKVTGKHEAATVTQVVVIDKQGAILSRARPSLSQISRPVLPPYRDRRPLLSVPTRIFPPGVCRGP